MTGGKSRSDDLQFIRDFYLILIGLIFSYFIGITVNYNSIASPTVLLRAASNYFFGEGTAPGSGAILRSVGVTIIIRNVLREGRRLKEVYPKGFVQYREPKIKIAADEIVSPEKWKDKAYVYALSRITIGISPLEEKEWTEKSFAKFEVSIKKDEKGGVIIPIPEPLEHFYLWSNSSADITVNDDLVLATVKTEIPIIKDLRSKESIALYSGSAPEQSRKKTETQPVRIMGTARPSPE